MRTIDRSPPSFQSWYAVSFALVSVLCSGFYSWLGLAIGSIGFTILVVGLIRGANRGVTVGGFFLFVAGVLAGAQGVPPTLVLVGVTASVVAWDSASHALTIGRQLGHSADTLRIELVHSAASTGVGLLTAVIGLGIFRSAAGNQPATALLFSILGAVLLIYALD